MVVVIDYKMGNLRSIVNRFERIGSKVCLTSSPEDIAKAEKIVLPGVGSFDKGMKNLTQLGLIDVLNEKVLQQKTPILGICLGMQLFSLKSEEGSVEGLGWIKAQTKRFCFPEDFNLRIPHVGWNKIVARRPNPLLESIAEDNRFYFTHSYHVVCEEEGNSLAETPYGDNFTSVIHKDNIFGVQFHPETSHKDGIQLLKNFVELTANVTN